MGYTVIIQKLLGHFFLRKLHGHSNETALVLWTALFSEGYMLESRPSESKNKAIGTNYLIELRLLNVCGEAKFQAEKYQ